MPTPLGHALTGLALAWSARSFVRPPDARADRLLVVACAAAAVAADFDFIYPPSHRTATHSLAAIALSFVAGLAVWRRRGAPRGPAAALVIALAYGSHILLDWLGGDSKLPAGVQMLWPFSGEWFISGAGLFVATYLSEFFAPATMLHNGAAIVRELLVLSPLAYLGWRLRNAPRRILPPAAESARSDRTSGI